MPTTKKLIGAAAFSLALAGGGVAGALLGTPGSSGAQETTTVTPDSSADAGEVRHVRGGRHLETAAEALGMTADELRAELEAGKTIADVATEKGVDLETVIDALVTEATVDLREHVTAMVNGELPEGGPRPGGPGGHHGRGGFRVGLDTVAETLGITPDELHTALEDGQSIAQVAEAQGVDVQTVIDTLVAEANAHIDEKVAAGDLTEDEAAERKAEAAERITDLVNREGGLRRGGGPGPRP